MYIYVYETLCMNLISLRMFRSVNFNVFQFDKLERVFRGLLIRQTDLDEVLRLLQFGLGCDVVELHGHGLKIAHRVQEPLMDRFGMSEAWSFM